MQNKEPTIPPAGRGRSSAKREFQGTPLPRPPQTPSVLHPRIPQTSEEWRDRWRAASRRHWRTEPEINEERQEELRKCRAIIPDLEKGIYPFKGMKLSRADVEWLLATHDNGRGPVVWGGNESQSEPKGLDLRGADLSQENLSHLPLAYMQGGLPIPEWEVATEEQRNMAAVRMEQADLEGARLQGANLGGARLQGAFLNEVQLQGANLFGAQLQGAYLRKAQLQGAFLGNAQLQGAFIRGSNLDGATLDMVKLSDEIYGSVRVADVKWGDVNLTVVDWDQVSRLDDEQWARQQKDRQGCIKSKRQRLGEYKAAVRAYRQLSVALQSQGLNEEAARFAYRAQVMQRGVFWFQMIQDYVVWGLDRISLGKRVRALGGWLFSWFLFLLTGYGYKPLRSFLAYVLVIAGFAMAYYLFGLHDLIGPHRLPGPHYLSWYEAVVVSMTAFHGRGFFVGTFSPGDPQALVAAIEAFFGLLIEVTFIATLTQRLFSR